MLLKWRRELPNPYSRFSGTSDLDWLNVLIRSINEPVIDGVQMPGFPSDEIQRNSVGASGEHTLREAFNFFSIVKRYANQVGRPLKNGTRVLDFGCGWGRILRFFLKDCGPANLWGLDLDPDLLVVCKETMPQSNFVIVPPLGPTTLESGAFDVITAYSVFSHLAEHASLGWIKEFSRLLKPGGLMIVTTEPRDFIELCRSLRGREHEFAWYTGLANSFVDTDAAYAAYDSGQYLYSGTGGGLIRPPDFYGEALIPKGYVQTQWTPYLNYVDFVDDRGVLPQALIVMQKPL
jgi:SAM-dependent methyltransferase